MSQIDYWDCVKFGCGKLGVPDTTFRTWKTRGYVSRNQAIPLYQVLSGTKYEVTLDQIKPKQLNK